MGVHPLCSGSLVLNATAKLTIECITTTVSPTITTNGPTPTTTPTINPSQITNTPTTPPTINPTYSTDTPTVPPTNKPTTNPTVDPTVEPTIDPTVHPTLKTIHPSNSPSIFQLNMGNQFNSKSSNVSLVIGWLIFLLMALIMTVLAFASQKGAFLKCRKVIADETLFTSFFIVAIQIWDFISDIKLNLHKINSFSSTVRTP